MMLDLIVPKEDSGLRLDVEIKKQLPEISRMEIQKAIRAGCCLIDNQVEQKPDYRVLANQSLVFNILPKKTDIEAEDGYVPILWQDEHLLVCNKPADLTVHPCPSCPSNTVIQKLLGRFPTLSEMGGERPGIVHRLDKDTSGLLLIALDEETRLALSRAFAHRQIEKTYLALVKGKIPLQGECREPVGRHPEVKTKMTILQESHGGRSAMTTWQRLWHNPSANVSLALVRIFTGRTHQIRVHMEKLGFPIIGDKLYGGSASNLAKRQMLHAWRLSFVHPVSREKLDFEAPIPEDFMETIKNLCVDPLMVVITGNQGCGKSTASKFFKEKGCPVISADEVVKSLYARPGPVSSWLETRLFANLLNSDGSVHKQGLFAKLENDEAMRKEFLDFVHSLVRDEILEFYKNNAACEIVVAEVPLYFESGWDRTISPKPFVIGIQCQRETRWSRIGRNRGWTLEKITQLEAWQMPEATKMKRCDFVLSNNGSEEDLQKEIEDTFKILKNRAEEIKLKILEDFKNSCSSNHGNKTSS